MTFYLSPFTLIDWSTGATTLKRRKRFNAIVIQPETTLGDTLLATPEVLRSHRKVGKERAEKVMREFVGGKRGGINCLII